jgi:hypothetical protein
MGDVPEGPNDSVDPKVLHDTLLHLMEDVQAHFGGREPTEEELRTYLADRLRKEGKSEAEIEEILG